MHLVSGGQTVIAINGEVGHFFCNKRAVRQGEPLSPLLFDFLVDALDLILNKVSVAYHIRGMAPHLILGGVARMLYAEILRYYDSQPEL